MSTESPVTQESDKELVKNPEIGQKCVTELVNNPKPKANTRREYPITQNWTQYRNSSYTRMRPRTGPRTGQEPKTSQY